LITRHRLTGASFDAIAAGRLDMTGFSALRGGQLSKHLLMLRMLTDGVRSRSGHGSATLGALGPALDLLTEAHRRDPTVAGQVIGYPYVGAWLARCVRGLASHQDQLPWTHLSGIAAAAAIRADVDFELDLRSRRGSASLPSVGVFRSTSFSGFVTVRRSAQHVTVDGVELPDDLCSAGVGWHGLRQLNAAAGISISLTLDDLDPYRATPSMRPAGRLARTRFSRWRHLFTAAWGLLCRDHSEDAAQLAELLVALTPLRERRPGHGISATARRAFGAIALTLPGQVQELAASLCHELQHAKVNALLDLVELCEPADRRLYYAPWRPDPRPLLALIHGTYAFLGVAEFWLRRYVLHEDAHARYEFARLRSQVQDALDALQETDGLTAAGRRFVTGMTVRAAGLAGEKLPDPDGRRVELAGDDHRVMWRMRNLRPDPAVIRTIVEAWRAGLPVPVIPGSALVPQPEEFVQTSRAWLLTGAAANRVAQHPAILGTTRADAVAKGDMHLVEGRYDQAVDSYRGALTSGMRLDRTPPDGVSSDAPAASDAMCLAAWTGLALAHMRATTGAEAETWRRCPELVPAVHRALAAGPGGPPAPEELARWLAAGTDRPTGSGGWWFDIALEAHAVSG
jgi:HEXXH motif-containing protein